MKILAVVHGYLPELAAGSERMLQHLFAPLVTRGHDVELWAIHSRSTLDITVHGVRVRGGMRDARSVSPDVIVAHHGPGTRYAAYVSRVHPRAALVVVVHNDRFDVPDVMGAEADLFVFNTRWLRRALDPGATRPAMVVHPPLVPELHRVNATGDRVTLVNLQANKGVGVFAELIRTMHGVKFLGVAGTHGTQEVHAGDSVDYLDVQQDMRDVWRRTRVLLVPSAYESYGMVAAEACTSGIPVIAHPTPGLRECLGDAGMFLDRRDVAAYRDALAEITTNADVYADLSATASRRATFLARQTERELAEWTNVIEELAR